MELQLQHGICPHPDCTRKKDSKLRNVPFTHPEHLVQHLNSKHSPCNELSDYFFIAGMVSNKVIQMTMMLTMFLVMIKMMMIKMMLFLIKRYDADILILEDDYDHGGIAVNSDDDDSEVYNETFDNDVVTHHSDCSFLISV
jgi:hypothetical protein